MVPAVLLRSAADGSQNIRTGRGPRPLECKIPAQLMFEQGRLLEKTGGLAGMLGLAPPPSSSDTRCFEKATIYIPPEVADGLPRLFPLNASGHATGGMNDPRWSLFFKALWI